MSELVSYKVLVYAAIHDFQEGMNEEAKAGWLVHSWQENSSESSEKYSFVVVFYRGRR